MHKTIFSYSAAAALLAIGLAPGVGSATVIHNTDVTPAVIMGSGIPNGYFSVDQNNGIELGLRARLRPGYGSAEDSNGGTWIFHAGEDSGHPGWATWNVDWSVNVDYQGSSNELLKNFTYLIGGEEVGGSSGGSSGSSGSGSFDPIILPSNAVDAAALACAGNSFGNNSTSAGGGIEVDCQSLSDIVNAIPIYCSVLNRMVI